MTVTRKGSHTRLTRSKEKIKSEGTDMGKSPSASPESNEGIGSNQATSEPGTAEENQQVVKAVAADSKKQDMVNTDVTAFMDMRFRKTGAAHRGRAS